MSKKKYELPKLHKNNNKYYELRFRISIKLVPFFRKKIIIKSLESKNLKSSTLKAKIYYNEYLKIIHYFNLSILTDIQIQDMVDNFFNNIIKQPLQKNNNQIKQNEQTYSSSCEKFLIWYNSKNITNESKKKLSQFMNTIFIPLVGSNNKITTDIVDIINIKNKLQNLPNRNYVEYRSLSLVELLKIKNIPEEKKLTDSRVKCYIKYVKQYFKFCYRNKYIDFNPSEDISIVLDKSYKRKIPFEIAEIQQLLTIISQIQSDIKYLYFIYFYSGMRREEAFKCKMKLNEDNIWYFDLSANQGFTLKTHSSYRKIPVHKKLLELGLTAEILEKAKLITSVIETGRQFNVNIKRQVTTDSKKTLHSLRHTFNTQLKYNGVETSVREEILGHEQSGTNNTVYSEDFPLPYLQEQINKVDYKW